MIQNTGKGTKQNRQLQEYTNKRSQEGQDE